MQYIDSYIATKEHEAVMKHVRCYVVHSGTPAYSFARALIDTKTLIAGIECHPINLARARAKAYIAEGNFVEGNKNIEYAANMLARLSFVRGEDIAREIKLKF